MIITIFRNPVKIGAGAAAMTGLLIILLLLMGSIILQLSFPIIGETIAGLIGHGRFARFIQLLY